MNRITDGITKFGQWLVNSILWVIERFTFLRSEHIRSVAFLYVCWQGERSWRAIPTDADVWNVHFIITMTCLVSAIGLAWQAQNIKLKIAGMQASLGQAPIAASGSVVQDMSQLRSEVPADDLAPEPVTRPHHGDGNETS